MPSKPTIEIYDATLRDGSQGEGVTFSVADKVNIARCLDEAGFHYIEGGWPGSNPKDMAFFKEMRTQKLKHAKLAAFGMTRRKDAQSDKDENLLALLEAETPVVTVVGKSWDLHVTEAIKTDLPTNLAMIEDSVRFIKSKGREVIYDAEHFFDGYKHNADYALATVQAAAKGDADKVVLCDTNGGSLPEEVSRIVKEVRKTLPTQIGIHVHNDGELAVANTLAAVASGATHVQGTVNGIGERCGNVDLLPVIANLTLKMGYATIGDANVRKLTAVSLFVYETANLVPRNNQPFVGQSAFAHKGGIHVSAVQRNPVTYEHLNPESVGNVRRILISELSGRSTLLAKVKRFDPAKDKKVLAAILNEVQDKEHEGYHFEAAEASFDLLVRRHLGEYKPFFDLKGFRVMVTKEKRTGAPMTEATVKIEVDGKIRHCAGEGDGPVDALNSAFRQALLPFYPELAEVSLIDYKVRIINAKAGTAAKVRVIIESRDRNDVWSTIGVSENLIDASWQAMVDSVEYKLLKDQGAKAVTG